MSLAFLCGMPHHQAMASRSGTWLVGFGIGLAAGILGPSESAVRLGLSCLLVFCGWLLRKRVPDAGVFCMGALWAFSFNPPVLSRNEPSLHVVRQATLLPSASRVIVGLPDGREFQAKGEARNGEEGRVRCFKRTWFFEACRFQTVFSPDLSIRHPVEETVGWLRGKFLGQLGELNRFERSWLMALILGDESELSASLREDFKKSGLYHLLVVSGFHFTVLCRLLEMVVRGPFQLTYLAGLISSRTWVRLTCCLRLVIVACAFLYGLLVGFQAPCQRALLGFGVTMLEPLFHGRVSLCRRMRWTAVLQGVLFPGGFASVSNFLSWGAYVFVVAAFAATGGFLAKVMATLLLQLKLLILSFALIGKASLIGVMTNALLAPFFPIVFIGGLVRLFQSEAQWTSVIAQGQFFFVSIVRAVADASKGGLLSASPRRQGLLLAVALLLFWHALARIQKSLEGPSSGCYPRGRAIMKGGTNGKTVGREDHPYRRR